MMLVMMAGCWVRNWFSPVPLCRIPGRGTKGSGHHNSLGALGRVVVGWGGGRDREEKILETFFSGAPPLLHEAEGARMGRQPSKAMVLGKEHFEG